MLLLIEWRTRGSLRRRQSKPLPYCNAGYSRDLCWLIQDEGSFLQVQTLLA